MKKKELEAKRLELENKFKALYEKVEGEPKQMLETFELEFKDIYTSLETLAEKAELISEFEKRIPEGFSNETIENITTAIEDIKTKFQVLQPKRKTLVQFLEENKDKFTKTRLKSSPAEFSFKAASVIMTTDHITPQPNPYLPVPYVNPTINPVVSPSQRILEYVSIGTASRPTIVLINEVNGEGDAEWVPEGGLKPLMDFDFATQDAKAKKIAVRVKLSDEMLDDIDFMASETERLVYDKLMRKLRADVLSGDGTGNNIKGVSEYAGGYAQTCLNGKIQSPGLPEVLKVSSSQIKSLGFDGTQVAFVNTCDWTESSLRKNANGSLLDYSEILKGIEVVETGEMTVDNFLIGDLSKYQFYIYRDYTLEYFLDSDDIKNNTITARAEMRVIGVMSDNNVGALVKDTISNVISLIEKP